MFVTPCVSLCKMDEATKICLGCKRTYEEVRDWHSYSSEQRMEVMRRLGYARRMGREERLRNYERG
jgi:predicted Fe-S protein YdhL (DUF1289 family)